MPRAPSHPDAAAVLAPASPHRSYQLHIDVPRRVSVTVGRLGTFHFPAGRYVYTGSARRNMGARLRRHRTKHKPLRWHIDYLLAAPGVTVEEVHRFTADECTLNLRTGGILPVAGFGASDCRRGCGSHLKYAGPA